MSVDEAFDMPTVNWQQQGSFEIPELPPTTEPDEGPFVCLPPINRYWLPYVMGALDQLRNPSSWLVADDAAMYATLARVAKLRQMLGVGVPCVSYQLRWSSCTLQFSTDDGLTWTEVDGMADFCPCVQDCVNPVGPPPVPPGGPTGDQLACNIAEYIAITVIQLAFEKQVANVGSNNTLLQIAADIAAILADVGFVYTLAFITAVQIIYSNITSTTLSDFEAALTDTSLWANVKCCIYLAIRSDGFVTEANFPDLVTCLGSISYAHAEVVSAIHDYVEAIGWHGLAQIQQGAGGQDNADCLGCGSGWCYQWTGSTIDTPSWEDALINGNGPFTRGTVSGTDLRSVGLFGTLQILDPGQQFSSTFVTGIRVNWTRTVGNAGADSTLRWEPGGHSHALIGGDGTHDQTVAIGQNCTSFSISIDSNSAGPTDYNYIHLVEAAGTGSNPFGTSNC
jgi:hypothetical protein